MVVGGGGECGGGECGGGDKYEKESKSHWEVIVKVQSPLHIIVAQYVSCHCVQDMTYDNAIMHCTYSVGARYAYRTAKGIPDS